jgi:hypothetical protein
MKCWTTFISQLDRYGSASEISYQSLRLYISMHYTYNIHKQTKQEYAGFGRFGCIKDCGRFQNTTKLYINMQDFFEQVKMVNGWDLTKTNPVMARPNPRFSYNIWSE